MKGGQQRKISQRSPSKSRRLILTGAPSLLISGCGGGGSGGEVTPTPITPTFRPSPNPDFDWFTANFSIPDFKNQGPVFVQEDIGDVWKKLHGTEMSSQEAFVDAVNGDDKNNGFDRQAPMKTVDKALRETACGKISLAPGTYQSSGFRGSDVFGGRPKMIVAPSGGVTIACAGDDLSKAFWRPTPGHMGVFETDISTSNFVTRLLTARKRDTVGLPMPIAKLRGVADVALSTAGWWFDPSQQRLYLRFEGDDVDLNIKSSLTAVYGPDGDNRLLVLDATLYIENITLHQGILLLHDANTKRSEIWLKRCNIRYSESSSRDIAGGTAYSQDSTYYRSAADHANYTTTNGSAPRGVEINDATLFAGDPDTFGYGASQPSNPISDFTNKNGSSNHDGTVVRVGGRHQFHYGPAIADTTGSKSWCLGVICGQSIATGDRAYGYLIQGASAWLDGCTCEANPGINSDSQATVFLRACVGDTTTTSDGKFTRY